MTLNPVPKFFFIQSPAGYIIPPAQEEFLPFAGFRQVELPPGKRGHQHLIDTGEDLKKSLFHILLLQIYTLCAYHSDKQAHHQIIITKIAINTDNTNFAKVIMTDTV